MDVEELRKIRRAYPFRPYIIRLEDGREILIDQPASWAISPLGNAIIIPTHDNPMQLLKPEWVKEVVFIGDVSNSVLVAELPQPGKASKPLDVEELRTLRRAYPFKAFAIRLFDGRQYVIDKHWCLAISPLGDLVVVSTPEREEFLKAEWITDAIPLDLMGPASHFPRDTRPAESA